MVDMIRKGFVSKEAAVEWACNEGIAYVKEGYDSEGNYIIAFYNREVAR